MRMTWIALAGLGLAGCATPELARGPGTAANPVFATQLAGPATYLAPMPTAVVVLTSGDLTATAPSARPSRADCLPRSRPPPARSSPATWC